MNNSGSNKNVLLAIALAAAVLFLWQYFIATPAMKAEQARQAALTQQQKTKPAAAPALPGIAAAPARMSREDALKAGGPRITVDTPMVDGSILLKGARLDDLRLKKYHATVDPKSPEIVLLEPKGAANPYYADFCWVGAGNMPNENSQWRQTGGGTLSPGRPVTLTWDNGHGLIFTRVIAIDDKYMFTVNDRVANQTGAPVNLFPYGKVERRGTPPETSNLALHVGFIGIAGNKLYQNDYKDFKDDGTPLESFSETGGWTGITDKYWMAVVIPPQKEKFDGTFIATHVGGVEAYQASYRVGARAIAPGASANVTHRLFAGAKVINVLREYQDRQQINKFDQSVDWGPWLWPLTRPFFWVLDHLYRLWGNFGLAILGLTVVVKLAFFPLANASFRAMSKMKKLQPQMEAIKKAHGDDPQKMQMEMMDLYRREKANPLSGCLPILLTIPVFFALYKVLFVAIEMRHAPFYGWIHDLSAPDPSSILNLFGLLPFDPHAVLPAWLAMYISVGVWPIVMGVTQWMQTKLNPAPTDPIQAKMFAWMPFIFTFMFATFPSGLVIYYAWNNLLTVIQQAYIMKREGVEISFFDNIRSKPKLPKAAND